MTAVEQMFGRMGTAPNRERQLSPGPNPQIGTSDWRAAMQSICTHPACERKLFTEKTGLCQKHHRALTMYGTTDVVCRVPECGKDVLARQFCAYHYNRNKAYGDMQLRELCLACLFCGQQFDVKARGVVASRCPSCQKETHREQMRKDRWRKGLWEKYRMVPSDYFALLEAQGGCCAICGGTENTGRAVKSKRLHVDHNHSTGTVRGLLCHGCNTGIGLLRDSSDLLRSAINYLEANNG